MTPVEYISDRDGPDCPASLYAYLFDPTKGENFATYIHRMCSIVSPNDVGHFTAIEVLRLRRLRVIAPEPPREMWPNIVPALWIAEQARQQFGPIVIGNGYRPRDLNRRVGGARRSQHIAFRALDLDLPGGSDYETRREFYRWGCEMWLAHGEGLKMGLGLYAPWGGSRIHVDCGYRRRYWKRRYVRQIMESMR